MIGGEIGIRTLAPVTARPISNRVHYLALPSLRESFRIHLLLPKGIGHLPSLAPLAPPASPRREADRKSDRGMQKAPRPWRRPRGWTVSSGLRLGYTFPRPPASDSKLYRREERSNRLITRALYAGRPALSTLFFSFRRSVRASPTATTNGWCRRFQNRRRRRCRRLRRCRRRRPGPPAAACLRGRTERPGGSCRRRRRGCPT